MPSARLGADGSCRQWRGNELLGARELHEKTLARRIHVLGADHPDTLNSKHNLACTLSAIGETSAAQALFDEIAAAKRRRVVM